MTHNYIPTALENHAAAVQVAMLSERLRNASHNAQYWEHRALAGERRMLTHYCDDDTHDKEPQR